MEWQDTIKPCSSSLCFLGCHEAQAKISFKAGYDEGNMRGDYFEGLQEGHKAGIKEVAEWEDGVCPDKSHHNEMYMFRRSCNVCRANKFKEWGIE